MHLFSVACKACCGAWPAYSTYHSGVSDGLQVYDLDYSIYNSGFWNDSGNLWPSVNNHGHDSFVSGQAYDNFPYLTHGFLSFFHHSTSGSQLDYRTVPMPQYNGVSGRILFENTYAHACYGDFLQILKIQEILLTQSGRDLRLTFDRNNKGLTHTNHVKGVNSLSGIPHPSGNSKIFTNNSLSEFIYDNFSGVLRENNAFKSGSLGSLESLVLYHNVALRTVGCDLSNVPTGINISGFGSGMYEYYNQCKPRFDYTLNIPFDAGEFGVFHWMAQGSGRYDIFWDNISGQNIQFTSVSENFIKLHQDAQIFLPTTNNLSTLPSIRTTPIGFEYWAQYTAGTSGTSGSLVGPYRFYGDTISGQCTITGMEIIETVVGTNPALPSYGLTGLRIDSGISPGTNYFIRGYIPGPNMVLGNVQYNNLHAADYPDRHTLCPFTGSFPQSTSMSGMSGDVTITEVSSYTDIFC